VVTHSARISLITPLTVVVLSLFGWFFLANPSGAEGAPTGSVRFEIVDAVTGEPLVAFGREGNTHFSSGPDGVALLEDVPVGEHTYGLRSGRYGATMMGVDGPGEFVTVVVVEGEETTARVEMTPPGKVRFQAITELEGDPLAEVNAFTYFRSFVRIGDRLTAVDGWFEIEVFPAPIDNLIILFDQAQRAEYPLPNVESGEIVSLADPMRVPDLPSVRGIVVDPDGNPVEGALVVAPSHNNGNGNLASDVWMTTGSDGLFHLVGPNISTTVLAYPPEDRPDLAIGGPGPGGLRGREWPANFRHPTLEIALPTGQWIRATPSRQAPSVDQPLTVFLIGDPRPLSGFNLLDHGETTSAGWTNTGLEIQPLSFGQSGLIDVHVSLRPNPGDHATLGFYGGTPLDCTLTIDCPVHRTSGPYGEQLVVQPNQFAGPWSLFFGPGEDGLIVDPPALFGASENPGPQIVDVSTIDGCSAPLTLRRTTGQWGSEFLPDAPAQLPGSVTFDGQWGTYALELTAAGTSGVVMYWIPPGPGTFIDLKVGGALPASCTPATTSTTTTSTTTTSTTQLTTTTTSTPPTGSTTTTTSSTPSSTTTSAPTAGSTTTSTTSTSTTAVPVTVAATTSTISAPVTDPVVAEPPEGYVVSTSRGSVYAFGELDNVGDAAAVEVVAIALHPSGDGYWIFEVSGEVHSFGGAVDFGRLTADDFGPGERAATMAATPSGDGYWLITNKGRVFGFGDAVHHGDLAAFELAGDVIAAAATPSGDGYYLVGSDGGIFSFGDAAFAGSIPQVLPGVVLAAPIVGLTADPDGVGYWLVAADGGVFGFDAPFRGSIPGVLPPGASLVAPINGMVPFGNGYLLVAGDGGVFNFSNLPFLGSLGDVVLDSPIVAISAT